MTAKKYYLWTPGQIIRIRFDNGDWPLQAFVRKNLTEVLKYANLRIMWLHHHEGYPKQSADIRIDFGKDDPKWKHLIVCAVGTECYMYSEDKPTMRLNAVKTAFKEADSVQEEINFRRLDGVDEHIDPKYEGYSTEALEQALKPYYINSVATQIRHEALHLLGFAHEQRHPASGIPWKVNSDMGLSEDEVVITEYDETSLAHYPSEQYKQHVPKGMAIPNVPHNSKLSELDKRGIRMLYPFETATPHSPKEWDSILTIGEGQIINPNYIGDS